MPAEKPKGTIGASCSFRVEPVSLLAFPSHLSRSRWQAPRLTMSNTSTVRASAPNLLDHQVTSDPASLHNHQHRTRQASRHRFLADLSQCLFDFVIQLLPTPEELSVKEDVRKLLERLIRTIEPDSRLLSFGSTANGFSLRNSGAFRMLHGYECVLTVDRYGSLLPH